MALISKRFNTAKKTVGPGNRARGARGETALSLGSVSVVAPETTNRAVKSGAAAVFETAINARLTRLRTMVDRAMIDSDENKRRSRPRKVTVKA
ncbi:hypothetical protein ACT2FY_00655 [Paraburkholderia fungorum]|uniref:hypothetical protein n=1 Tax=Paraburkholderia fungorum TaxID=134537 RepID=UPI00402B8038